MTTPNPPQTGDPISRNRDLMPEGWSVECHFLEQREHTGRRPGTRRVRGALLLFLLPLVRPHLHPLRNSPLPLLYSNLRVVPHALPPPILHQSNAGHLSLWGTVQTRQQPLPHVPTNGLAALSR
jgi:hypothetical protein